MSIPLLLSAAADAVPDTSTPLGWLRNTPTGLIILCVLSIALLLALIIWIKLEPFIALLLTGVTLALVAGISVYKLVGVAVPDPVSKPEDQITPSMSLLNTGFGGILGSIAVVIGLGTILGAIMERTGGADVLVERLLKRFGEKSAPIIMGVTGFLFGIPVFFDIGIFVLAPLVYVTARRGGKSLALYALPMVAGLSVTHAFLPPHPGPTALAGVFGVNLGWIIIMGLACGIPAFLASGIAWPLFIGRRIHTVVPPDFVQPVTEDEDHRAPVKVGAVAVTIVAPIALILLATGGTVLAGSGAVERGPWLEVVTLLGTPAIALTLSIFLAIVLLGRPRGISLADIAKFSGDALKPVGMILLVVGAGAFYGSVISATGIGKALSDTLHDLGLPIILTAFLISAILRIAQGGATAAIVITAGIIQPVVLAGNYSQPQLALIGIAISAGSIILSHVNDGGFWIIQRFFNMTVPQTLATWTVLETILSLVGFGMVSIIWLFV